MSILKKVLLVLVIGIGGFLAFAATRPDNYRVERSQRIDAPADVIQARKQETTPEETARQVEAYRAMAAKL